MSTLKKNIKDIAIFNKKRNSCTVQVQQIEKVSLVYPYTSGGIKNSPEKKNTKSHFEFQNMILLTLFKMRIDFFPEKNKQKKNQITFHFS